MFISIKTQSPIKNSSNNINWLLSIFCTAVNNAGSYFPGKEDTNNVCEIKILKSHSQPKMMQANSTEVKRGNLYD